MKNILLFLTNSLDATCDYLCKIADEKKLEYIRFDTNFKNDELKIHFDSSKNIKFILKGRFISPDVIHCVWNRRPEKIYADNFDSTPFDEHYRDEWRHAIDGFFKQIHPAKWVNYPFYNALAISKIEQLHRAKKFTLDIPKTLVTQDYSEFKRFYDKHNGEIITKPISHGYICDGNSVYNIYTNSININECSFENFSKCPNLFQEEINKTSDIRINFIDGYLEAIELIYNENCKQRLDIRKNNMDGVSYKEIKLPHKIKSSLIALIKSYKLRFCVIDMGKTEKGEYIFFEINPNGQWAWMDILGVSNFHEHFIKKLLQ
jgi:hypothetical protein